MALPSNLKVDGARLWSSIHAMAEIGPGVAGGSNRQALTDEDAAGRALLATWCGQAGLTMTVDALGNMFARRAGQDPDAPPVVVGSHLDTQPTGGRYDGVLGVLAGLEMVRTLNDLKIATRHPIEVVNWTNEEGARFAPSMIGAAVFAGAHTLETAYGLTDAAGLTLGDELVRIGYRGDVPCGGRPIHALFELHIEQGPILEEEDLEIGVVTHGQGLRWIEFEMVGQECHTGSTPMPRRRNAGLGMARMAVRVDEIARSEAPHGVGAIGHAVLEPNARNIVAGRALFTADLRHPDAARLKAMEAEAIASAAAISEELNLDHSVRNVGAFDPVTFDANCVGRVRTAAARLGYRHRDIVSGAGHDACFINAIAPTAMIFCPCEGGLSHNEAESITPAWAEAGANVLLHAALETAGIVDG